MPQHSPRLPLLEVHNLSTKFASDDGEVRAVDNVSFTIYKGETLGLVGESGSGKSVTALSILRLLHDTKAVISGSILYYNSDNNTPVDLLQISEAQMQLYRGGDLAMVFQEPATALNPVFTCGAQVAEAILTHKKCNIVTAKQEVLALFAQVNLPDPERIYNAYPHQLSGGQKQRVMIAMAMSCNPTLLIADEPTTALDVTVQKAIVELMADLQKQYDMAILFITHDLGVVAEVADSVAVMYKGRIVETGTVAEIFATPKHPYTRGLLACRPSLAQRFTRLPTVADFMDVQPNADWFLITEKAASVNQFISDKQLTHTARTARQKLLAQQPNILQVQDLTVRYAQSNTFWGNPKTFINAVDNVSFNVKKGETLGLVGESGCGKTTLGRAVLRLIAHQTGKISYDNTDISASSDKEMLPLRQQMQIIFQDPFASLNPRQTVSDTLTEPMYVHQIGTSVADRKARAAHLLDTVGLQTKYLARYSHELSGGQRQRVCIARALALSPRFIICDECVSALDVSVQAQVLNLLMDLREQFDLSYIFISHDLSVVKQIADRMLVMHNGQIIEQGDADDIYTTPQQDYTKRLIAAIPSAY